MFCGVARGEGVDSRAACDLAQLKSAPRSHRAPVVIGRSSTELGVFPNPFRAKFLQPFLLQFQPLMLCGSGTKRPRESPNRGHDISQLLCRAIYSSTGRSRTGTQPRANLSAAENGSAQTQRSLVTVILCQLRQGFRNPGGCVPTVTRSVLLLSVLIKSQNKRTGHDSVRSPWGQRLETSNHVTRSMRK